MTDTKLPAAASAAEILDIDDSDLKPVEVKEWKRTVFVRVLSAAEALDLQKKVDALPPEAKGIHSIYLNVAACLADDKGKALFSLDDCEKLATRNQKVLIRLHEIANAHNRPDAEAAKNA